MQRGGRAASRLGPLRPPRQSCSRRAVVTSCSTLQTGLGAGAGGSEMQFSRPHPRGPRVRPARGLKAVGRPDGGVNQAHGAPVGPRGSCGHTRRSLASLCHVERAWGSTGQSVYLPMIKTHRNPPSFGPAAVTAASRSQLPCVGPRSLGLASRADLSALCSTAALLWVLRGWLLYKLRPEKTQTQPGELARGWMFVTQLSPQ